MKKIILIGAIILLCLVGYSEYHKHQVDQSYINHSVEFDSMSDEDKGKIMAQPQSHIQAIGLSSDEVVNIKDKNDIIVDRNASFVKNQRYLLTFHGDFLTKVEPL